MTDSTGPGPTIASNGPDFAAAIIADGPTAAHPRRMAGFGRFVGTWSVHSSRLDETSGDWIESDFTWIVSYILDGMAVQDVAVVPSESAASGYETISTTLRVYDRIVGAWRVSYVEPKRGEYCQLVATPHRSDGIRQDGTRNDDKLIRWNFSDITSGSYRWESWVSDDEGATWWLQEHNEGRRTP